MDENKLLRYIQAEPMSDSELTELLDWVESSSENLKQFESLKQLWVLSGITQVKAEPNLRFFKRETKFLTSIRNNWLMKYAAIFILAFWAGLSSLYLYNRYSTPALVYNEIQVPDGQKSMIILYDGTKVWLNSGTNFRYPATFSRNERKVFLKGEGFFDVAKNEACPFIVNASNLNVKVLGTRFNVDAYNENKAIRVTLERGAVVAQAENSKELVRLAPGEQAIFRKSTNKISKKEVDTELFSSWKENLLRFRDAPLNEVIVKMEHWYGVQIELEQSINVNDRFTMAIKTESLREMLNLISKTIPITYEINGDKVLIKRP